MRKCSTCKQLKPLESFNRNRSEIGGYSYECKDCKHQYYLNNKDKSREQSKKWARDNPSKVKIANKKDREGRRKEVLEYYSGGTLICSKCGFSDIRALTIDHINGGKNKYPLLNGNGLYCWLKTQGYPGGFQVLCMNCQFIKKVEKGETRNA